MGAAGAAGGGSAGLAPQDVTSGITIENDKYSGYFPGKSEFLTIE